GAAYRRLFGPLVREAEALLGDLLAPIRLPAHPAALLRFSTRSALPAATVARRQFDGRDARALFAGLAAHSFLPLTRLPSAAFGLVLGILAHLEGWPCARGGSQRLADSLVSYLSSLGGEVETGRRVGSLAELGPSRPVLLDLTPRQVRAVCGDVLPRSYARRLER